ncbi:hypothetical protein TELCIR_18924, partial [Teladorsagia circumcincta]
SGPPLSCVHIKIEFLPYDQLDNPEGSLVRKFQMWSKRFLGVSMPFFYGRGLFQYLVHHNDLKLCSKSDELDKCPDICIDIVKDPTADWAFGPLVICSNE